MIRKHIKVEPELYYYYADSLGFMVWQDMPSGFESAKAKEQHVGASWEHDWNAPESHELQWRYEFEEMYEKEYTNFDKELSLYSIKALDEVALSE